MAELHQETAPAASAVAIEPRISNPAALLPDAWEGIQKLLAAIRNGGLDEQTIALTHMRASQINGCSACIDGAVRHARKSGGLDDRLVLVAGWRDSPRFTERERAALALTEAVTRLADSPDPVPDAIWEGAAEHYDERALAALVLHIALTNLFNRLNVTTRQPPGDW